MGPCFARISQNFMRWTSAASFSEGLTFIFSENFSAEHMRARFERKFRNRLLIRKDLIRTAVQIPLSTRGYESRSTALNDTEPLGRRGLSLSAGYDSTSVSEKMCLSPSLNLKAF